MMLLVKAIQSLVGADANFRVEGSKIIWLDSRPQPTQEQIEAKIKELEEQEKFQAKYNSCKNYIYKYYPQEKQASDIADKVYYETLLRAKGINNLEQDIVNRTTRFYNGETIEEIIADVDDEDKVAYEQLLKVAIRTKFVQDCKLELKKAIDENKEIEYPKYPL